MDLHPKNTSKSGKHHKITMRATTDHPWIDHKFTMRILWITVAATALVVLAITAWAWIHTAADEGIGRWRTHHLTPSSPTEEAEVAPSIRETAPPRSGGIAGGQGWAELPRQSMGALSPVPDGEVEAGGAVPAEESWRREPDGGQDGGGTADGAVQRDPGAVASNASAGGPPVDAPDTVTDTRAEEEIVYRHKPNDRMEIALSFDDGPHPYYTPLILDILAEYGIRATFFMVGENVTYYTAAAEAVVAAGHEIGNHTQSHRTFTRMNEGEMRREIADCEEAIASVSEVRPHFIRPPEGEMSAAMRRVVGGLDYRIILWDVDTRDWAHTPPEVIRAHILDTVEPGDIILMHDFIGHDSPTPEALRLVIPALLERGYRFVTVGELVDGA